MYRSAAVILFVLPLIFVLSATHAKEVKEHPLIRPFPGSKLMPKGVYQDFSEYSFWVTDPETKKAVKKNVKGKFWKLTYRLYDSKGNWDSSHSILEYRENYKQAAIEKGGTILYENGGYLTFILPGDNGSTTWCEVHIWNKSQQDIRVIEEAGFKKNLTFGPAEMKAALDAEGRIRLYGILFDVDKATLQQDSTKELQHVVTLLKKNPELKLEVQGHTDNQGADGYNLQLSKRRAETVVNYLGLFGIEPGRLNSKGFGETRPIEPNSTEEGRTKNRRVELVKASVPNASVQEDAWKDLRQFIVGKWDIAPNGRASQGSIIFHENNTYELQERHYDGVNVTTNGEYAINSTAKPFKIDLCLEKCGKPGSEWTTRFGIFKVLSDNAIEIRTSADKNYPKEFSDDKTEEYTMRLTRTE